MSDNIGLVILAAGAGTRLKMDVPKPLAPMCNQKLVSFPLQAAFDFLKVSRSTGHVGLVLGHGREAVESYLNETFENPDFPVHKAHQTQQNGTADAVRAYLNDVEDHKKTDVIFILCADTPVISQEELMTLYSTLNEGDYEAVAATFETADPTGYGRVIKGGIGFKIVEEKDANDEQRKITEVNSGLYAIKTSYLLDRISKIDDNNKSGEFYLTDIFSEDANVAPVLFSDENIFIGVNDLTQLQRAERNLRWKHMRKLRDEGVRFIDLSHTYIDPSVEIGAGSVIYPNVFVEGKTLIGKNCIIEPGSIIRESVLEDNVEIKAYSHLENSVVRKAAGVGPYGRLRPGADVGPEAKIGNFVEVKKAILDKGVKVSHLSYVGDAEIGENTNIGCGFITCNYDGSQKHKTKIGKNSFIGSDTQMIAPVELGEGCYVASGSTINQDMPTGSFGIARAKQVTKENMAKRFIKTKS